MTGSFKIKGAPSMDCSWFDENLFQKVVNGSYQCVGNHTKPTEPRRPSTAPLSGGENTNGTGNPTTSSTAPLPSTCCDGPQGGISTNAKIGIGVGVVGIAIIMIAVIIVLVRKHRKLPVKEASSKPAASAALELHSETKKPQELPSDR